MAAERLAKLTSSRQSQDTGSIIARAWPGFVEPVHLTPIASLLERSETEPVEVVASTPPQHGKTTLLEAALLRRMMRHRGPDVRHSAYATYSATRVAEISVPLRERARELGLDVSGTIDLWGTRNYRIKWTSVGGALTGFPIDDLLAVDDPLKDHQEAVSTIIRQRNWDWFNSVAQTRRHPGSSCIVVATRWHDDDLSGRLTKAGWSFVNLQAIDDETGAVLWPERRPLEWLQRQRQQIGEYLWAALYQGRPRPRGAEVFGEPTYYEELPTRGYQCAYGVDLAYTAKTHADYSVCLRLLRKGDEYYVAEVQRKHVDAPSFALTLKAMHSDHPGPMVWHASGVERGTAQFIQKHIKALRTENASADKFVRALPAAAAWNSGKILVPTHAPWLDAFVSEVCNFTGLNDAHDDQVDALASAYDALSRRARSGGVKAGTLGRWGY